MTPTKRHARDMKLDELERDELRKIQHNLSVLVQSINNLRLPGYTRNEILATLFEAREDCWSEHARLGNLLMAYRARTR